MIKYKTICTFLLFILLTGCGQDADMPHSDVSAASELGLNLLIEPQQGTVSLNREKRTKYTPVSFGAEVQSYDLLRPEAGQAITILCADLVLLPVTEEGRMPCQVEKPLLLPSQARVAVPRGLSPSLPYILQPRSTAILDAHPLLRWHDSGADSYTVAILHDGHIIWEQSGVSGTELRYPDEAPDLERDTRTLYLLRVVDEQSQHHSGEDPTNDLGFRLVTEEEQAEIERQRDKIMALALDESARDVALAVYYAGKGVHSEAVTRLSLVNSDSPTIHLREAEWQLAMQLPNKARTAYENALQRAQTAGDKESEAAAQAGLACVAPDEAQRVQAREAATVLYEELGYEQAEIEALLAQICQ